MRRNGPKPEKHLASTYESLSVTKCSIHLRHSRAFVYAQLDWNNPHVRSPQSVGSDEFRPIFQGLGAYHCQEGRKYTARYRKPSTSSCLSCSGRLSLDNSTSRRRLTKSDWGNKTYRDPCRIISRNWSNGETRKKKDWCIKYPYMKIEIPINSKRDMRDMPFVSEILTTVPPQRHTLWGYSLIGRGPTVYSIRWRFTCISIPLDVALILDKAGKLRPPFLHYSPLWGSPATRWQNSGQLRPLANKTLCEGQQADKVTYSLRLSPTQAYEAHVRALQHGLEEDKKANWGHIASSALVVWR